MAASHLIDWCSAELTAIMGFEQEDATKYVLAMQTEKDVREFLEGYLPDTAQVRTFVDKLVQRMEFRKDVQVYMKAKSEDDYMPGMKKSPQKPSVAASPDRGAKVAETTAQSTTKVAPPEAAAKEEDGEGDDFSAARVPKRASKGRNERWENLQPKDKKKGKSVNVNSLSPEKDFLAPGRKVCNCQATRHTLVGNCLACGKIICEQEGREPCTFCGTKLGMKADARKDAARPNYKDKKKAPAVDEAESLAKATAAKERLVEYDRTHTKRTTIIDDQADWFSYETDSWMTPEQKAAAKSRAEALKAREEENRRKVRVSFDFAGRTVTEVTGDDDAADTESVTAPSVVTSASGVQLAGPRQAQRGKATGIFANNTLQHAAPVYVSASSGKGSGKNKSASTPSVVSTVSTSTTREQALRIFEHVRVQHDDYYRSHLPTAGIDAFELDEFEEAFERAVSNQSAGYANTGDAGADDGDDAPCDIGPALRNLKLGAEGGGSGGAVAAAPAAVAATTTVGNSSGSGAGATKSKAEAGAADKLADAADQGLALSMHQPWASFVIKGIKKVEGRNWDVKHRGRLWIASTVRQPTEDEIQSAKDVTTSNIPFPAEYPLGSLLGCVDVVDCLTSEEYERTVPVEEQEYNSSAFLCLCKSPRELFIPIRVSGQHKIWPLPSDVWEGAKRGLKPVTATTPQQKQQQQQQSAKPRK